MRLVEIPEQVLVRVGEVVIEGWLVDAPCSECGSPGVYYLAYAATFCAGCNIWLDQFCDDPDCVACRSRPQRPLTAEASV